MPHVLVAGRIHEAGIDVLRSALGVTFEVVEEVSTDAYAPRIPGADALLIRTQPLPARIVAEAPKLRIVSRHGVGHDSVRIAGAGLDVFEAEPPTANGRLLRSSRTVLSPHIAGLTEECAARMGEMAARNILDFFAGRLDPALVVNQDAITFGSPGARAS